MEREPHQEQHKSGNVETTRLERRENMEERSTSPDQARLWGKGDQIEESGLDSGVPAGSGAGI